MQELSAFLQLKVCENTFSVVFQLSHGIAILLAKSVHSTLNGSASQLACVTKSTCYAWIPLFEMGGVFK